MNYVIIFVPFIPSRVVWFFQSGDPGFPMTNGYNN